MALRIGQRNPVANLSYRLKSIMRSGRRERVKQPDLDAGSHRSVHKNECYSWKQKANGNLTNGETEKRNFLGCK
jgi:hypothetical protein